VSREAAQTDLRDAVTSAETGVLGARIPMVDAEERVTGTIAYTLNVELPRMLYAAVLRSPHAHARIVSIDASRAESLPGVVAVLTSEDFGADAAFDATMGLFARDEPLVALDRVRHVGDRVAAVAAEDEGTAEEALGLFDVEYEPLPAVLDVEEALEPGAPVLHEGPRVLVSRRPDFLERQPGFEGTNVIHLFTQRRGDVEAGFASADVIVENVFSCPPVQHVSMEPHVCVAHWESDRLTVWASSQAPHWLAEQLAMIFRLPKTRVRVIVPTLGGGFGGKIDPTTEPVAAALALKARRPVRLCSTREEEFFTGTKHGARVYIKTGLMRDGTLVAHEARCYYNGGAYQRETAEKIFRGYVSMGPYRVPNIHVDSYGVYTNVTPSTAFRGFGVPQVAWAHESQMDVAADALEMDPLELRRKNVYRPGDLFSTGEVLEEDYHYPELLDTVADKIGWSELPISTRDGPRARAKGMAAIIKGMSAFASTATVKLNADGSLEVLTSSVEMGQGALTALAQVAAHELGVPVERVRVSTPDTALTPFDQMTAASRTTNSMGRAIRSAVGEVREQLLSLAAEQMEIAAGDLVVRDGMIVPKGAPDRARPIAAIVGPSRLGNLLGSGTYFKAIHLDTETGQGLGAPQWHPCVCGVEVEVDEETGRVTVLHMELALYLGRAVNPTQCELQVVGASLFGLGQALFEEIVWDEAGQLLNPNLSDYMIPSFLDVPPTVGVTLLEDPDETHVHGIGETALPSVAPAIANAVSRAVGVRVRDLPLVPERVLELLRSREAAAA
jgi:CO/xanthine dehydrogenase Mo-binding subunit